MLSHPSSYSGLSTAEVNERRSRGLTNNFKPRVGRTYWQIVRDNVFNLFNIVLGTLLLIVVLMNDYSTALFAGFSVVTNSILGTIQEINAKRKLDKLAALAAKEVRVWRDGALQTVSIYDLVQDDVIPIEPGDKIVVDGRALASDALEMDESQLTGESDSVFKLVDSEMHSGSFCIAGTGVMVATRVGKDSTINQLSVAAKAYKNVKTPTQQRLDALVELMVVVMLLIGPMLFFSEMRHGQSLLNAVRSEVVFVSSIVPQGLVLTALLSLTLGAISISRHQTLIQRVNAVESLANVTTLCFDKTGTLTQNKLAVTELLTLNGAAEADIHHKLQLYLKNLAHLNHTASAVATYSEQSANHTGPIPAKVREIPFSSTRKWGAIIFEDETLVMGAPERLLVDGGASTEALERARDLSRQGLRVLAFGRAPELVQDSKLENVEPLALIILSDQVRPDIQTTLDAFREQNVRLKVISGDNLETVQAIARQSGMSVDKTYTGQQLEAMSPGELDSAVAESDLFARIEPETKRKIIGSLKKQGEYVAMVGDGVNDVPALKESHLAIVMNDGTQISKDVSDIVLLNNAMSTLPLAFKEGTQITQSIFGTTKLFLTKNFYNIVLIFFVGFMTLPFPTTPVQISWITFGTVNIPATLIAIGWIRPGYMARFRRDVLDYVFTAGVIGAAMLALLYVVTFFAADKNTFAARSAVTLFIAIYGTLIFWNIHEVELFWPRTMIKHWRVTLFGFVLLGLTMIVPFLKPDFFDFIPPTPSVWVLIVTIFFLTAVIQHFAMENRHLINRMWAFLKP
ncbi:MAG: HAD-IC family P-type ATPase [Anaerolineaceae bacterium]|nr:HAD-IC family P-type ATPase [Anaerolineaceae bacterium]